MLMLKVVCANKNMTEKFHAKPKILCIKFYESLRVKLLPSDKSFMVIKKFKKAFVKRNFELYGNW